MRVTNLNNLYPSLINELRASIWDPSTKTNQQLKPSSNVILYFDEAVLLKQAYQTPRVKLI